MTNLKTIAAASAIALMIAAPAFAAKGGTHGSSNAATPATAAAPASDTSATPATPGNDKAAGKVATHRKMGKHKAKHLGAVNKATPATPASGKDTSAAKATPGNPTAQESTGRSTNTTGQ